jgi:hypothetical protein
MAAACECEVNGNIPIAKDDVIKKIKRVTAHSQYQFEPVAHLMAQERHTSTYFEEPVEV